VTGAKRGTEGSTPSFMMIATSLEQRTGFTIKPHLKLVEDYARDCRRRRRDDEEGKLVEVVQRGGGLDAPEEKHPGVQGLTLVHFPAQPEPVLTQDTP